MFGPIELVANARYGKRVGGFSFSTAYWSSEMEL